MQQIGCPRCYISKRRQLIDSKNNEVTKEASTSSSSSTSSYFSTWFFVSRKSTKHHKQNNRGWEYVQKCNDVQVIKNNTHKTSKHLCHSLSSTYLYMTHTIIKNHKWRCICNSFITSSPDACGTNLLTKWRCYVTKQSHCQYLDIRVILLV